MENGYFFFNLPSYEISVKLVLNYYNQTLLEPGFNLKALQPLNFILIYFMTLLL